MKYFLKQASILRHPYMMHILTHLRHRHNFFILRLLYCHCKIANLTPTPTDVYLFMDKDLVIDQLIYLSYKNKHVGKDVMKVLTLLIQSFV